MNNRVYINFGGAYEGGDCFTLCDDHLALSEANGEYPDTFGSTDEPCWGCQWEQDEQRLALATVNIADEHRDMVHADYDKEQS